MRKYWTGYAYVGFLCLIVKRGVLEPKESIRKRITKERETVII